MYVEINIIVSSASEAAAFYENLFDAEILSKTALTQGNNETKMLVGGTPFRVLDENKALGLVAPSEGVPSSVGVNVFVDDINEQIKLAENAGCAILSPVTEFPEQNAINAVFKDVYGHIWVINQKMD